MCEAIKFDRIDKVCLYLDKRYPLCIIIDNLVAPSFLIIKSALGVAPDALICKNMDENTTPAEGTVEETAAPEEAATEAPATEEAAAE